MSPTEPLQSVTITLFALLLLFLWFFFFGNAEFTPHKSTGQQSRQWCGRSSAAVAVGSPKTLSLAEHHRHAEHPRLEGTRG